MATFRIGESILTYTVIGAGLRHGWLPPPLPDIPYGWEDLGAQELVDLEAFEAAGWRFHRQPDLDWRAAENINGGVIQAALPALHPLGGLVILRDLLVVSLPEGVPPLTPEDAGAEKIPINRNVYAVRIRLPDSDLESAIVHRIAEFKKTAERVNPDLVAEPLLLYHLQNSGALYSIGAAGPFQVRLVPTIQNHWKQIHLAEAWAAGTNGTEKGKGVWVAVIDKGFDLNNLQIQGNIKETAYVNDLGSQVQNATIPNDRHGTMCAGLVGAIFDNQNPNGAAPECSLMLVAVESIQSHLAIVKAIELCVAGINGSPRADVISCSLGLTTHPWEIWSELKNAIDAAHAAGTLVVWADFDAHERITPDSVEGHPYTFLVGQCDSSDNPVSCGYGPTLDLLAPGVNVNGLTGSKNGCSCAAPEVAGVAALVLAKHPGLTVDALAKVITDNCSRPMHANSRTDDDGWGRLDAKLSVEKA